MFTHCCILLRGSIKMYTWQWRGSHKKLWHEEESIPRDLHCLCWPHAQRGIQPCPDCHQCTPAQKRTQAPQLMVLHENNCIANGFNLPDAKLWVHQHWVCQCQLPAEWAWLLLPCHLQHKQRGRHSHLRTGCVWKTLVQWVVPCLFLIPPTFWAVQLS